MKRYFVSIVLSVFVGVLFVGCLGRGESVPLDEAKIRVSIYRNISNSDYNEVITLALSSFEIDRTLRIIKTNKEATLGDKRSRIVAGVISESPIIFNIPSDADYIVRVRYPDGREITHDLPAISSGTNRL